MKNANAATAAISRIGTSVLKRVPSRASELRALDVVAVHLAHGVADLAFGRVGAGGVEDAFHHVLVARLAGRSRRQRLERRGRRLVVSGAPQLLERSLLLVLHFLRDVEDRDLELLVGLDVL